MGYEQRFSNLNAAIDGVQAHFQQRIEAPSTNGSTEALCRLKIAVHEWIANLVRHAHFGERVPEVGVRIWKQGGRLRCAIEDNSIGFDLNAQVKVQRKVTTETSTLPEGGMGLLLVKACTERAEYLLQEDGDTNRLKLSVPVNGHAKETVKSHEEQ